MTLNSNIDSMKTNQIIIAVITIVVLIGAFLLLKKPVSQTQPQNRPVSQSAASPANQQAMVGVADLNVQNASSEHGQVYWGEKNNKVVVTIDLVGEPGGASQPAHLHVGTCQALGAVKYPLANVVDGKSVTTLNVTLDQLKQDLPLIANVHKSDAQINVYVACGEVSASSKMVSEDNAMKMMQDNAAMMKSPSDKMSQVSPAPTPPAAATPPSTKYNY